MGRIGSILVVGGGTAGWLTAAYLARFLGAGVEGGIRITLVESSDIGILGVGEGTFPTIKNTLAAIGIDEARFLRATTGTFKQGIRFPHWVRPPGAPGPDHYFHPFNQPNQRAEGPELLPYWLLGEAGPGVAFAAAATMQKRVADRARGPKRPTDPDYRGPMNYAYHFDAGRFAALLAEQAMTMGVRRVLATVDRVELDAGGAIAQVITREHGALSADLYVDCSGFKSLLIGGALGAPFRSVADTLFVDRAVALQVPYDRPDAPIPPYTISTAHEAGWTWDIALQERRGVGYVYSSRHTDDGRAEEILRAYVGPACRDLPHRQLRFQVGYRDPQWVRNCVAVGLSAGFLEPLESTGIGLIEMGAYLIAHLFPFDGDTDRVAAQFNQAMAERYRRIVDFIKMHYCLTRRTDHRFWIDNADPATIPASLADRLAMWRCRPPHRLDFIADWEMFQPSSWQFVLYGMEFRTDLTGARALYPRGREARHEFEMIQQVSERATADLPPHRALVDHIVANGLGPLPSTVPRAPKVQRL